MMGSRKESLMKSAFILTLAGIISKILSAGYRIPLQNLTGDKGLYIYQQIYPIIGIVVILSLYGFPTAVARIAGEYKANGKEMSVKSFYLPLFTILFFLNGLFFVFLFLNAENFAHMMDNDNLIRPIQTTSFIFLCVPFISILRGSFQGEGKLKPTAISQVIEQVFRVGVIIVIAVLFYKGLVDIYAVGTGGALASMIGAVIAIVVLFILFLREKPYTWDRYKIPWTYYIKMICLFGIVTVINQFILLLMQSADAFTLLPNLIKYGLSQADAMQMKGVFDRGYPLIQVGIVLGASFAVALVPTLSKKMQREEPEQFLGHVQNVLKFNFYLASGATLGLMAVFPLVNVLLFKNDLGTTSLQILAMALFFSASAITISSILQSLGYHLQVLIFVILTLFVKWGLNMILVPLWGIKGSALATVCAVLSLFVCVAITLKRKEPTLHIRAFINWPVFLLSSMSMSAFIFSLYLLPIDVFTLSRLSLLVYVMGVVIIGAGIYGLILLRYRVFTDEELSMLPFQKLVWKIARGEKV